MGIWGNDQPRGNDINVPAEESKPEPSKTPWVVPRVTGRHDDVPREGK